MPELPQQQAASPAPAAPAAPEKTPAVPQSSIAAELERVYDQKKAEADAKPSGRPAAVSPGQGTPAPEQKTRDESGRFASTKAPDAKSDAKVEAKDAKPAAKDAKPEAKAPEAKAGDKPDEKGDAKPVAADLKPHPRWKPEVQEKFKKLAEADPDLARYVLEHQKNGETAFTQGRQAMAVAEKFKGLEDVLAPGRQARSLHGVDDPAFLRSLVSASDMLAKDPRAGLKMLAEQYGVDLKEVAEAKDTAPESPVVRQLQQQVSELTKFIASQHQGAQHSRVAGALQSIEAFKQQKDESGQLLYPHFDDVVDELTAVVQHQLQSGQQPDLKAAYTKAIRLNDGVWMKLQAADSDRARKQREEEEAQRIKDAKLAGFSPSGSGAGGASVGGSIAEELRRQVDKHFR